MTQIMNKGILISLLIALCVSLAPAIAYAEVKGSISISYSETIYNGKPQTPDVIVKLNDNILVNGVDYTLSYKNNQNVGMGTVTVIGIGNFSGIKEIPFKILKAKQPMTAKASAKTVKFSKVKKKAQTVKKAITVKSAQGTVSYKNVSTDKKAKKLKVNSKNGNITVPKKTKKGTYKVKVKVTAKGDTNYDPGDNTVTIKIKVK